MFFEENWRTGDNYDFHYFERKRKTYPLIFKILNNSFHTLI